ncbi:uncharacterized protein [Epargyreus clarus]|uniref:uncharacterized protein n=1 Tax=Epargyreus clarus TaxID=520877 RepID=UPI003C2F2FCA
MSLPSCENTGTSRENTGASSEKTGPSRENTGASSENTGPSRENTGASSENTGPSRENTGASSENTGPSRENTGASSENTGPSGENTGASSENTEPSRENTGASSENTVPSCEKTGTETDATDGDPCEIPPKSRKKYMQAYKNFLKWKKKKKKESFSEIVFLEYFKALAKDRLPSTLWSTYSMLKTTVRMKNNINMRTFKKLSEFLKAKAKGHKNKISNVLTSENVKTFLNEAPDEEYLLPKVALIIGIEGACRGNELLKLTVDDIKKKSDSLFVKMIDSKTNKDKSFTIRPEYADIVKKYLKLRPMYMKTKRFFIQFRDGKCMNKVIGKNRFSVIAQEIASYLDLDDALFYTGHCFRRTSAILFPKSERDQSVPEEPEEEEITVKEEITEVPEVTEVELNNYRENEVYIITSVDEDMKSGALAIPSTSGMSPRPSTSKHKLSPLPKEQTSSNTHCKIKPQSLDKSTQTFPVKRLRKKSQI